MGVEDARQSLFWQLLVLVASTNSFHRLALNVSWLVHFGVSLMVAVRISAKRESCAIFVSTYVFDVHWELVYEGSFMKDILMTAGG